MSESVPPPGYVPAETYAAATPPAAPSVKPVRGRRRSASQPKLLAGAVTLIVLGALAVTLFGGSAATPGSDPITQAAAFSSRTAGYRMKVGVVIASPSLPAPITASGGGIVDLRDRSASMTLAIDLSQLPQAASVLGSGILRMGMIIDGSVLYMRFPAALAQALPGFGDKQWVKIDLAKLTGVPGLSSLGGDPTMSDPSHMLQYLQAASDDGFSDQGQQVVDGVQTTHYHALLSLDRLSDNLPPAEQSLVQEELSKLEQATQTDGLPVDVWIDGQHLVRRMMMNVSLHVPNGGVIQETVTADFGDYGPQSRVSSPPSGQVQDLSSLVGGAGG